MLVLMLMGVGFGFMPVGMTVIMVMMMLMSGFGFVGADFHAANIKAAAAFFAHNICLKFIKNRAAGQPFCMPNFRRRRGCRYSSSTSAISISRPRRKAPPGL